MSSQFNRIGRSIPRPTMLEGLETRQLLSAAVAAAAEPSALQASQALTALYTSQADDMSAIHSSLAAAIATTTVVTSSAAGNTSVYGTSITFTATVTGTTPTGTVTFFDGATNIGTGTAGAGGTWKLQTSVLSAGSHNITAVYGGDTGNNTSTSGILVAAVTPKALAVLGITAGNKTFDGLTSTTLSTGASTLVGFIAADQGNVTLNKTNVVGNFVGAGAGTGKTVAISGLTLAGTAAANYTLTQPTTTANITPLTITITGVTAANKIYDGTTTATLDFSAAVISGILASDAANITLLTTNAIGNFSGISARTGLGVIINGVALGGSAAGNYTFAQPSATANITPRALTVTGITAVDKTYDGTTAATISTGGARLFGLLTADRSSVTLVKANPVGTFASKNAGTLKTITIAGLSLTGASAANYSLTPATATANIRPKAISITGITADSKVYDATTTAVVHFGSATLSGILAADLANVSISAATGVFTSANVGTGVAVSASVSLGGSAAGNYSTALASAVANITPRALTVTGVTATKIYDGTTAGAKVSVTGAALIGLIAIDVGKVAIVSHGTTTGTFSSANAGTTLVTTLSGLTLTGQSARNYSVTQPSITATITQKNLVVTGITGNDKIYDGTTGDTLNTAHAAVAGVLSADSAHVTLVIAGSTGTFAGPNVGNHVAVAVSGLTITGTAAGNYNLVQPATSASITVKSITVTGITASDKVYDGTTNATLNLGSAALSGVVAGDVANVALSLDNASGLFGTKNAGNNLTVSIKGLTISGSAAGNYVLTAPTITARITAKAITVTGITVADKVYDGGTTTTAIDASGAELSGFLSADRGIRLVSSGATGTFSGKNVGTGLTVTISGLSLSGSGAANYVITPPSTMASITAKALTVTGITAGKVYDGTTIATLNTGGAALSGVAAADLANVTLNLTGATPSAFTGSNVGTYTIAVSGLALDGSASANYTLTQPAITAQITPKSITATGITASNKSYNGTSAATIVTSAGVLSGVVAVDLAGVALVSTGATGTFADKNAGNAKTVTITGLSLSGTAAANYTLAPTITTANIVPKAITVSGITASNKTADGTTVATINTVGAIISGVLAADIPHLTLVTAGATGAFSQSTAGTNLTVAISGLSLSGTAAANYSIAQPTTTANIT